MHLWISKILSNLWKDCMLLRQNYLPANVGGTKSSSRLGKLTSVAFFFPFARGVVWFVASGPSLPGRAIPRVCSASFISMSPELVLAERLVGTEGAEVSPCCSNSAVSAVMSDPDSDRWRDTARLRLLLRLLLLLRLYLEYEEYDNERDLDLDRENDLVRDLVRERERLDLTE